MFGTIKFMHIFIFVCAISQPPKKKDEKQTEKGHPAKQTSPDKGSSKANDVKVAPPKGQLQKLVTKPLYKDVVVVFD